MNMISQLRLLAVGLAIGIVVLGLPVESAEATSGLPNEHVERKPRPQPKKLCTVTNPDGSIDFFLPGEILWDAINGKWKRCGSNGKWLHEGETEDPDSPVAPRPTGGGVLSQ